MNGEPEPIQEVVADLRQIHFEYVHPEGTGGFECAACEHVWPCPTIRVLNALTAALAEVERLKFIVDHLLAEQEQSL